MILLSIFLGVRFKNGDGRRRFTLTSRRLLPLGVSILDGSQLPEDKVLLWT